MMRAYDRLEVMGRLHRTMETGQPVIGCGASIGLVAKCAEASGADLIIVYSTGKSRIMGMPTRIMGNANDLTLQMMAEIRDVVEHTPMIGGTDASDLLNFDHNRLLNRYIEAGFSGVINCPSLGAYGPEYRKKRDSVGHGFNRELALTSLAHEKGLFTMAYCYNAPDAVDMVRAGVDCVVAHAGATRGGMVGYPGKDYDKACDLINEVLEAARKESRDVICLAHGGPFAVPEDTKVLYDRTTTSGYVGASSIERIPIEMAVTKVVKEFRTVPFHNKR